MGPDPNDLQVPGQMGAAQLGGAYPRSIESCPDDPYLDDGVPFAQR